MGIASAGNERMVVEGRPLAAFLLGGDMMMLFKKSNIFAILVVLIVVETQYIINGWVSNYGGNKQIVDYVSFAGTIVSIILAVLAIVYSYYQNFSQQRDSHNLSRQIDNLKIAVSDAESTSRHFSAATDRLEEIGKKLDQTISLGESSRDQISELRRSMEEKAGASAPASEVESTTSKALEKLAAVLQSAATVGQLAIYYILVKSAERGLDTSEIKKRFGDVLLNSDPLYDRSFFYGAAFTLWDAGIFSRKRPGRSLIFQVQIQSFADGVKSRFEGLEPSEYANIKVAEIIEIANGE